MNIVLNRAVGLLSGGPIRFVCGTLAEDDYGREVCQQGWEVAR